MDCPYCRKPMEKGYIPARKGRLFWLPEDGTPPLFEFSDPADGAIALTQWSMFSSQRALAYCCKACGNIVLPIPKLRD